MYLWTVVSESLLNLFFLKFQIWHKIYNDLNPVSRVRPLGHLLWLLGSPKLMCTFWLFLMHSLSFINKTISEYTSQTNFCLFAGTEQAWNFLKRDAVPSIFTWTKESSLVTYHCPADFKRKFLSTRVIIDATEIRVKQPSNTKAQSLILQLQTCKHYEGTCWCDSKCLDIFCFWCLWWLQQLQASCWADNTVTGQVLWPTWLSHGR